MKRLVLLLALLGTLATHLRADTAGPTSDMKHTFTIGPKDFLLDGKPFVIRCGEIHFPRVPREYWKHRLDMCKAMGLNAVCVYLFWNYHEWTPGKYDWSGQKDVAEFCRLAQQEGLWVILRPGPYSCAEWEMGGLPWWLLKNKDISLRSRDPKFLEPAMRYIKEVGRVLGPYQVTHGGPILMAQVENEYGWFGKDTEYVGALRKAFVDAGFDVTLFQCNPAGTIQNGYRPDLFQVVNFGANGARAAFDKLAQFQKTGPLMNGEYYPGWFDSWGGPHKLGPVEPVLKDLEFMLQNHHSFSIYMAHGGTSFGLWSGACNDAPYSPVTSSYDYDAPISEAGWVTPKFTAIRDLFAKYLQPGETLPTPPPPNPVVEIPPFTLSEMAPLAMNLPTPRSADIPGTMEDYDEGTGMILYHTTLAAGSAGSLSVKAAHDFAWIFLDGKAVGVMDRRHNRFQVSLPARSATARLDILVDAMGRVNFGHGVADRKGLLAPVDFTPEGGSKTELKGWQIYPLPLGEQPPSLKYVQASSGGAAPAFWRGSFTVASPGDTFLDMRTWGKGVVWVNGHCLGRLWDIGPTQTMYLPGPWLKSGRNDIVVLDLEGPRDPKLAGLSKPILDELHPEFELDHPPRAQ